MNNIVQSDKLKVSVIQEDLVWENKESNLTKFEKHILNLEDCDIVVLPEMFSTAFSMQPTDLAETMEGATIKWLKRMASEKDVVIFSSIIIEEDFKYYNRLLVVRPSGKIEHYDKRHLFRMSNEHESYSSGDKKLIVDVKGWKICPLVCYDLRFPVWSRNVKQEYDLLIYVANWPKSRAKVWNALLMARALENQSFVVAVNRVGLDKDDTLFGGDSQVIDFKGTALLDCAANEGVYSVELNKKQLNTFREQFPAYLDADEFEVQV